MKVTGDLMYCRKKLARVIVAASSPGMAASIGVFVVITGDDVGMMWAYWPDQWGPRPCTDDQMITAVRAAVGDRVPAVEAWDPRRGSPLRWTMYDGEV